MGRKEGLRWVAEATDVLKLLLDRIRTEESGAGTACLAVDLTPDEYLLEITMPAETRDVVCKEFESKLKWLLVDDRRAKNAIDSFERERRDRQQEQIRAERAAGQRRIAEQTWTFREGLREVAGLLDFSTWRFDGIPSLEPHLEAIRKVQDRMRLGGRSSYVDVFVKRILNH